MPLDKFNIIESTLREGEQFVGAEEVFLADELIDAPRPHSGRERLSFA